ncbi:MAG: hypothetical protein IJZ19_08005 [Lentisphaeria bacterium]|nr:hypothetical protein [Lentisphaeria bacterium]
MQKIVVLAGIFALFSAYGAPLQLISHAGEQYAAPGHSIPAYKIAIERKADIMKLDLHMTKDGVLVLMHDPTTNKMMDKKFAIRRKTLQELREQCTYKPKGGFEQEKIVRMEQALDLLKDTPLQIWIDLKGHKLQGGILAQKAMKLFKEYGIGNERLMTASFNQSSLNFMKRHYPDVRRVLHVSISSTPDGKCILDSAPKGKNIFPPEEVVPHLLKKAEELGLYGFNISIWKPVKKEWIQALKAKGLWISFWFIQNKKAAARALDFGGDAVVTDNLKEVEPFVRKMEKKNASNAN